MKSILMAVVILAGGLMAAGCQSSDTNSTTPSSVGNGQTRNNGPFAPDSNAPANTGATTQPAYHY